MVCIGLKFFSAPYQSWGMDLQSRLQIFRTNVKVFAYVYIIKTLVDFTGICYGDRYRSKVLFSMIPAPVPYLNVGYGLHIMCD